MLGLLESPFLFPLSSPPLYCPTLFHFSFSISSLLPIVTILPFVYSYIGRLTPYLSLSVLMLLSLFSLSHSPPPSLTSELNSWMHESGKNRFLSLSIFATSIRTPESSPTNMDAILLVGL